MIALNYSSTTVFLISILWCIYACISLAHIPKIVTVGLYRYAYIELHWIAENCFPKWLQQFKTPPDIYESYCKSTGRLSNGSYSLACVVWCYLMWLRLDFPWWLQAIWTVPLWHTHWKYLPFFYRITYFFLTDLYFKWSYQDYAHNMW